MKAFTDIEQSKKLSEILPIKSADMHYVRKTRDFMGNPVNGEWSNPKYGSSNSKHANYMVQNFTSYEIIPCWSLAALLDILDNKGYSIDEDASVDLSSYKTIKWDLAIDNSGLGLITEANPVDACYKMIIKLNEQKLL